MSNDFEYACNQCGREGHYGEFTHAGSNGMKCPNCGSTDIGAAPEADDETDPETEDV